MRALYLDLDGTLFGDGGSLLRDEDGGFSLLGARALEAVARVGAELVLFSGRRRSMLHENARVLGAGSYVFEAGAGYVLSDGRGNWDAPEWLTGELRREAIAASGAIELLIDAFGGTPDGLRLDADQEGREVTIFLRGAFDVRAANELLIESGYSELRVLDNGPALHLLPCGISKGRAVAAHRRARGYAPEECVAIGDSREDLGAADAVGTFWLVANGLEHDPSLRDLVARTPNAQVTEASYGEGVYEAVISAARTT